MKKTLLSLLASIICLATFAQGTVYVGYCDGQVAANGTGLSGTNATIKEAIRIPASTLAPYAGAQITGINAGIANASAYPDAIVGTIAASQDGEALATATLDAPGKGWNVISFATPYTITGQEEELWIAFEYVQSKKLSVISFVGESNPNAAFVKKNDKWTDYSSKGLGSLSLEAIISGENVPTRDLSITSFSTIYPMTKIGEPVLARVNLRNNASTTAVNPVFELTVNGQSAGSYTYEGSLEYRQSQNVRLEFPTDGFTEEGEINIGVKVLWADGSEDQYAADNEASVVATLVDNVFFRNMVVEEATGAWCGYCVRGIVGLKYMRETYPDRFIGIGVHNGDAYVVNAYDKWIGSQPGFQGYPSCLVNRDGKIYDPSAEELESLFNAMVAVTSADIQATVAFNADSTAITVHTKTQFLTNDEAANYKVAYVVLEDKLPITQTNYYSGGSLGEMGGFESLGSKCDIEIDDVARGIYPEPAGAADIIPSAIVAKEVYENDYELVLPELANIENAWLAVLLIDADTKEVVQAAKVPSLLNAAPDAIRSIAADQMKGVRAYDLMGRQTTAKGLQIQNGQVSFVR